jgi:hypothetical protein
VRENKLGFNREDHEHALCVAHEKYRAAAADEASSSRRRLRAFLAAIEQNNVACAFLHSTGVELREIFFEATTPGRGRTSFSAHVAISGPHEGGLYPRTSRCPVVAPGAHTRGEGGFHHNSVISEIFAQLRAECGLDVFTTRRPRSRSASEDGTVAHSTTWASEEEQNWQRLTETFREQVRIFYLDILSNLYLFPLQGGEQDRRIGEPVPGTCWEQVGTG